jgi:hypothetical protein
MGATDLYVDISQLGERSAISATDIIHLRATGGIDSKMTIANLFDGIPCDITQTAGVTLLKSTTITGALTVNQSAASLTTNTFSNEIISSSFNAGSALKIGDGTADIFLTLQQSGAGGTKHHSYISHVDNLSSSLYIQNTNVAGNIILQNNGVDVIATSSSAISLLKPTTITGALTATGGATIQGLTVGRGGGAVSNNTASGYSALLNNTTGHSNTASGYEALYSNTEGNYNTASGLNALYSNITGNYNTASGNNALSSNTTGIQNTASGYEALSSNLSFSNCVGLGYNAQVTGDNQIQLGDAGTTVYSYRHIIGSDRTDNTIDTLQVAGSIYASEGIRCSAIDTGHASISSYLLVNGAIHDGATEFMVEGNGRFSDALKVVRQVTAEKLELTNSSTTSGLTPTVYPFAFSVGGDSNNDIYSRINIFVETGESTSCIGEIDSQNCTTIENDGTYILFKNRTGATVYTAQDGDYGLTTSFARLIFIA